MTEETLFHQALNHPRAERAAFLDQACAGDLALRQRVEVLLQAHDNPASFLARPPVDLNATADSLPGWPNGMDVSNPQAEGPGSRIGPYKLLQQIGEGGMGTVWMAEQQEPVQRKVALKIIKPGMDSKQVVARFEAERQAGDDGGGINQLQGVAFSPDGKRLASGGKGRTVKVWAAATGQELLTFRGLTDPVSELRFTPDGGQFLAMAGNHSARVWDATTGQEALDLGERLGAGTQHLAFSPDGQRLVTSHSSNRGRFLKAWNTATGKEVLTLRGHTAAVTTVMFSPDGSRLVSMADGWVKIWDGSPWRRKSGRVVIVPKEASSPGDGSRRDSK